MLYATEKVFYINPFKFPSSSHVNMNHPFAAVRVFRRRHATQ